MVARQRVSMSLSTPEGSRTSTRREEEGSLRILAEVPAERTSLPPSLGRSSMLWIRVPIRIMEIGIEVPI